MEAFTFAFTKTVTGNVTINAKNKEDALARLEAEDWDDEFDYNSEYDFDELRQDEWL